MENVQPLTGAHEFLVGLHQPEFDPVTVGVYHSDCLQSPVFLTRWKLSEKEREMVAAGHDLYLAVVQGDCRFHPTLLTVGPPEWSDNEDPKPVTPREINPEREGEGG